MKLTIIGAGCGGETLTREAARAIREAELVLGSPRLLAAVETDGEKREAVYTADILTILQSCGRERVCVLFSGDSGFYSGARLLLPELEGEDVRVLPGISSVQALAARLGRPWQDWRLASAHGQDCGLPALLREGRPLFLMTGGEHSVRSLCSEITALGLGGLPVTVGEALYTEEERIVQGTAQELSERDFAPLSVLLAEPAPQTPRRVPGLPDAAFERLEGVPMTKQEVRACVLSKLAVGPDDTCWDIGAGTGSVSVELALQAKEVWAVEREEEALRLAERNRVRFNAWNLRLIGGEAPEALKDFPRPDAVFVGGSGGRLGEILDAVHAANPGARVCVSAIMLESLEQAVRCLESLGYETFVTQLAVSRARKAGGGHLMLAQNPVYLITGAAP